MDIFKATKPGNATLEKLNLKQLYLGVLTLDGFTNSNGTAIDLWALEIAEPDLKSPCQIKKDCPKKAG
eukprot:3035092-Ditylum_brightwellii.AAC.1